MKSREDLREPYTYDFPWASLSKRSVTIGRTSLGRLILPLFFFFVVREHDIT